MEEIEITGLVVREATMGEADQILTVLTADRGKVTVSAKGSKSFRSRHAAATQLFCYSTFQLRRPKQHYYITDSVYIENFMDIRYDVERLALATYLCDVAVELSGEDVGDPWLLQLTLNALYALAYRKDIPMDRIKAAYEFRAVCDGGYTPELSGCAMCGSDLTENCYLDVMNGRVLCKECQGRYVHSVGYTADETTAKIHVRLTPAVLCAMRYVRDTPLKRFLSFQLDKTDGEIFAAACERYIVNHLERSFVSLEYYHTLREYSL